MIYRDLSDVILISHTKNKGGITLASIVQRGGSYSVVYYTKENGIRKQKWESFRTEKDARAVPAGKEGTGTSPADSRTAHSGICLVIWQSKMVTVHTHPPRD